MCVLDADKYHAGLNQWCCICNPVYVFLGVTSMCKLDPVNEEISSQQLGLDYLTIVTYSTEHRIIFNISLYYSLVHN